MAAAGEGELALERAGQGDQLALVIIKGVDEIRRVGDLLGQGGDVDPAIENLVVGQGADGAGIVDGAELGGAKAE